MISKLGRIPNFKNERTYRLHGSLYGFFFYCDSCRRNNREFGSIENSCAGCLRSGQFRLRPGSGYQITHIRKNWVGDMYWKSKGQKRKSMFKFSLRKLCESKLLYCSFTVIVAWV